MPSSNRTASTTPSSTSAPASGRPSAPAATRIVRGRSLMSWRIALVCPSATRWPFTSTSTCGAIRSTSWSTCEETITVRPSSPSWWRTSMISRRWAGSRPFSGSSRSSRSGSCASAWASFTRWRMPCENPPTLRPATSARPTVSSARLAAPAGSATRCRRAHSSTTSCAVRNGHGGLWSGTTPTRSYTAGFWRGSTPKMRTAPVLGEVKPAHSLRVVDFPAPLWPSSPVTPGPTANDTSATATVSPYQRETPANSMAGTSVTTHPPGTATPARGPRGR